MALCLPGRAAGQLGSSAWQRLLLLQRPAAKMRAARVVGRQRSEGAGHRPAGWRGSAGTAGGRRSRRGTGGPPQGEHLRTWQPNVRARGSLRSHELSCGMLSRPQSMCRGSARATVSLHGSSGLPAGTVCTHSWLNTRGGSGDGRIRLMLPATEAIPVVDCRGAGSKARGDSEPSGMRRGGLQHWPGGAAGSNARLLTFKSTRS